jgi:SAM-dependent methyltransferase
MSDIAMEDWAGEVGDRWLAHIDRFESMIEPIGIALLNAADFQPGERVIDVGCGGGPTTLEIARRIGADGRVTGIDIALQLILIAEKRRAAAGTTNVRFQCADAQTEQAEGGPFDRLVSRFGVMFFADSRAAFANMRTWLRPGGEMMFACWGPPQENPWIAKVGEVIARFAEVPQRDPDGPGPFRFADPEATREMLESAGWRDVRCIPHRAVQPLGGAGASPEQAAAFVLEAMAMREVLETAGPFALSRAQGALIAALEPHYRTGSVLLPGMCWFVRATNPG